MIPEGGLVPQCPDISINGQVFQCECGLPEFIGLIQNLINFSIYLAVMALVLTLVYVGFLLVTQGSKVMARTRAKRIVQSAVIGFVIAISAFMIVDLIMRTFAQDDNWANILSVEGGCVAPTGIPGGSGGGNGGNVEVPGRGGSGGSGGGMSHRDAVAELAAAGISVSSSGSCSDRTRSNCTSLEGIRSATIDQVIELREACDCSVVVTGGTEVGHEGGAYSHGTGYKIDVRSSSDVTKFIYDNLRRNGSRGNDPRYLDRCGNEYVEESTHWDISVTNGSCQLP